MKNCIVGVLGVMISWLAQAHTAEENTAIACDLIRRIARAPENTDCILGSDTGYCEVTYPTYDSLFERPFSEGRVGHGWTAAEKREAFESFLMDVPNLAKTNTVRSLRHLVEKALRFADQKQATNAMAFAQSILATPCQVGESCACQIFEDRVVPSLQMNEFVELAVTNRTSSACAESLASHYAAKIRGSLSVLDRSVVTNGVQMLLRIRQKDHAARMLDKLLLQVYPDYSVSSNRLDFAMWALETLEDDTMFCDKTIRPYFDSITNQLLNATQPLVQLELP